MEAEELEVEALANRGWTTIAYILDYAENDGSGGDIVFHMRMEQRQAESGEPEYRWVQDDKMLVIEPARKTPSFEGGDISAYEIGYFSARNRACCFVEA